jgi:hypothetical protein
MSMVQKATRRAFPAQPSTSPHKAPENLQEKTPSPHRNEICPPACEAPPGDELDKIKPHQDQPRIDPGWLRFAGSSDGLR